MGVEADAACLCVRKGSAKDGIPLHGDPKMDPRARPGSISISYEMER